jgi:hypothetical protein
MELWTYHKGQANVKKLAKFPRNDIKEPFSQKGQREFKTYYATDAPGNLQRSQYEFQLATKTKPLSNVGKKRIKSVVFESITATSKTCCAF